MSKADPEMQIEASFAALRQRERALMLYGRPRTGGYGPCGACGKKRSLIASYCQHCGALGQVQP